METRQIYVIAPRHSWYTAWLQEQQLQGITYKTKPRYVDSFTMLRGISGRDSKIVYLGRPEISDRTAAQVHEHLCRLQKLHDMEIAYA